MNEAAKKAKKKYKAKVKRFSVDFYHTEAELYEHIQKQPQKQTYIKNLIRADMETPETLTVNIDGNAIKKAVLEHCPELLK